MENKKQRKYLGANSLEHPVNSPRKPIAISARLDASRPVRILARPYIESRSNPYLRLLYQNFPDKQTAASRFNFRRLLTENWTIWHYHWPETALIGIPRWNVPQAVLRIIRYYCYLKVAHIRDLKIVWTVHNLHPHESKHPRLEVFWLRLFARNIHAVICLSESGKQALHKHLPATRTKPAFLIPHGHYRGFYPDTVTKVDARRHLSLPAAGGVALFLGMIRPYKNVTGLVKAFAKTAPPDWTLLVAGKCNSPQLRQEITDTAANNPDVHLRIGFIPDEEIQNYFRAADIFVAPYEDVLNSGSAILALSFDCPALVPNKGAMRDLQHTVGREWVMTYDGPLTEDVLRTALQLAHNPRPQRAPLEKLDWPQIASRTFDAFDGLLNPTPPATPIRASGHTQRAH